MQTKKTVAIFTTNEGHESIAQAISSALEPHYHVVTLLHKDPLMHTYLPFYQLFPHLFSIPFKVAQYDKLVKPIKTAYKRRVQKKVLAFVDTHQPDILINTYMMFIPTLEEVSQQRGIPFINVIPDPKTVHRLGVSESATTNTVFDQSQLDLLQQTHPASSFTVTGWFVRHEFEQDYDQEQVRKKLKLAKNKFTLLIASGSEGTALIIKLVGLLSESKKDVQIIVACGNNQALYKAIRLTQRILRQTGHKTTLIPLKFVTNMHEYMQAADLVVGKAGPNTIFEAVATRTPFFAITHIAGQEDGNLDIIRDYHLGYVEENPLKATKRIRHILNNTSSLQEIVSDLDRVALHNRCAKPRINQTLQEVLSHSQ